MRFVGKLIAALLFSLLCTLALSPLAAGVTSEANAQTGALILGGTFIVALVVILFAPTVRRSWGRGFLLSGACFFFLPLSSIVLGGRAFGEVMAQDSVRAGSSAEQAASAIGAGIGAGLFAGMASILGLVVGTILLLFGLVLSLGGRREVIVVQRPQP